MIPDPPRVSYWEASPHLQRLCRRKLGNAAWDWAEPQFASMGERAALEVAPLAAVADRESPRLVNGRVEYHPAYREMQKIAYGSGMIAMKYPPVEQATFISFAVGGVRPEVMGIGPIAAVPSRSMSGRASRRVLVTSQSRMAQKKQAIARYRKNASQVAERS